MGGVNAQHQLDHIPRNLKSELISLWLAAGPPFLGSLKTTRILLSGIEELYFSIFGFYLSASIKTVSNQSTIYELLYVNPFKIYKNFKWFDWVEQR